MSAPDLTVDPSPPRDRQTYRPRRQQSWADSVTAYWEQVRALDFLMGAFVLIGGLPITVGGAPLGVAAAALIPAVAAMRRPGIKIRSGGLLLLAGAALYVFLVFVSIDAGTAWAQRIVRFLIILLVAASIATRRIHIESFVLGSCFALLVNVPAFYAGFLPDNYPPYLTGIAGDKNVAGLLYAVFGLLGLLAMRGRWVYIWILLSGAAVFLTGSRTSMSAFALALAWMGLRNRVGPVARVILAGLGVGLLLYVEESFARVGIFGDRVGTDWYREQIGVATQAKVEVTPWTGLGLNEGFVVLGGVRRVWMHNSYAQAFVEGGYVFLLATLAVFVILSLGLLDQRRWATRDLLIAESATVVVLVCAGKLGETFMTTPAFIVLGIAVSFRLGRPMVRADRWLNL